MREIITAILVILAGAYPVRADTVWDSGYHEIFEDDVYGEIWMYNDATADMFGGDVFKLEAFDTTAFDMLGGQMTDLRVHDNGIANLHTGDLNRLGITENGLLNLYAYDVAHHATGGYYDRGWIEGKYIINDLYFKFDFVQPDTFSHINIIPEQATIFLLGLGGSFARKRR